MIFVKRGKYTEDNVSPSVEFLLTYFLMAALFQVLLILHLHLGMKRGLIDAKMMIMWFHRVLLLHSYRKAFNILS